VKLNTHRIVATTARTGRPPGRPFAAHVLLAPRRWRRCKHGFVMQLPRIVRSRIRCSRAHFSAMLSNTCCTALLLEGAPSPAAAGPP